MFDSPFGGDPSDREGESGQDPEAARESLVDRLRARRHVDRERTAEALRAVPRHEFVPEGRRRHAYADRPLAIGDGQTISAPHMVAIMTDLLAPEPDEEILEIGTGCGYHAAVTAEIVEDGTLYSVEYVDSLAEAARERLDGLDYDVHVRVGDGREGWPERAPFDGAYLTCAAAKLPEAVAEQVRPGGRIVAPVGTGRQRLVRAEIDKGGIEERADHGGVRFVQMQG